MKYLNSKVLLITVIIGIGIAALLGIGQLWFNFMDWDNFIKSMVTIGIVGLVAGFLIAVDYDMPASKQKTFLLSVIIMSLLMGGMIIVQMWWSVMEWVTFVKIFGTIFILFLLVSFIAAVKEDLGFNKKLKDDKYLD